MKIRLPALLLVAGLFSAVPCRADSFTLTVTTNVPQGGTVTGAGVYQSGATATMNIQAAPGWYLSNAFIDGVFAPGLTGERFDLEFQGGADDITTITNDTETETMNGNHTLSVFFAPLSPTITQSPVGALVLTSNQVSLVGSAFGRQPILYQWWKDNLALTNQTNGTLLLDSAQPADSGSYTLVASNAFGTNVTLPAILTVKDMLVLGNGVPITNAMLNAAGYALFEVDTRFPDALIFYTLDGSTPDFNGNEYFGPFYLSQSCTLRAVAYSADFFETDFSDSIAVSIVPNYTLSALSNGGGQILFDPFAPVGGGVFGSNTTVTLTASPQPGFVFAGWSGDLSGTNPVEMVTMDRNLSIQASFATTLTTTAAGGGTVFVFPSSPLYPYGTPVVITAVPDPGNYFGIWGNAASGRSNPLPYSMTTGAAEVSALFAPLPQGQAAITVLADGGGSVSMSPQTNKCRIGATVTLSANPDPGSQFLGWTGDATGVTNPLSLVVNGSETITAHFSRSPVLAIASAGATIQLQVTGVPGDSYQIQTSDDLVHWLPLTNLINFSGTISCSDAWSPSGSKLYRAAIISPP
jgi:uncharacterized repeat protein (TIGR02543 family)